MADKSWDEMTTAEKVERLNYQLESVVQQINAVTGNINRRISNLEADIDELRKG